MSGWIIATITLGLIFGSIGLCVLVLLIIDHHGQRREDRRHRWFRAMTAAGMTEGEATEVMELVTRNKTGLIYPSKAGIIEPLLDALVRAVKLE